MSQKEEGITPAVAVRDDAGLIVILMNMDIQIKQDSVVVRNISDIVANNCREFKERVLGVLTDSHTVVELDLTNTSMVDSSGLGSLISLDKTMRSRKGLVRLLNPSQSVMTILELTRLHRVFEVVVEHKPASPDRK